MAEKETVHTGHRQRLRKRFMDEGLDNFNEINALELLLFYCVPRRDTNELAHRLIQYFGSYAAVLNAPYNDLKNVEGVSNQVATYLTLQRAAARYYMISCTTGGIVVRNTEEYGRILMPHFIGRSNETVYLLCLDAKCKVLCCREVSEGSVNAANISVRKIMDVVLSCNATSAILAHNHPGGVAVPSPEDIQTTRRVEKILDAVDVFLVDHLVIADNDYVSMRQSGYYVPQR